MPKIQVRYWSLPLRIISWVLRNVLNDIVKLEVPDEKPPWKAVSDQELRFLQKNSPNIWFRKTLSSFYYLCYFWLKPFIQNRIWRLQGKWVVKAK